MTNLPLFGPELDPWQKERRYRRWSGFVLSPETAASWALRVSGKELHPIRNGFDICDVLENEVRPYRAGFSVIGEELEDAQYVIVTQSAKFNGYRGMDPNEIPQFKEGQREAVCHLVSLVSLYLVYAPTRHMTAILYSREPLLLMQLNYTVLLYQCNTLYISVVGSGALLSASRGFRLLFSIDYTSHDCGETQCSLGANPRLNSSSAIVLALALSGPSEPSSNASPSTFAAFFTPSSLRIASASSLSVSHHCPARFLSSGSLMSAAWVYLPRWTAWIRWSAVLRLDWIKRDLSRSGCMLCAA